MKIEVENKADYESRALTQKRNTRIKSLRCGVSALFCFFRRKNVADENGSALPEKLEHMALQSKANDTKMDTNRGLLLN